MQQSFKTNIIENGRILISLHLRQKFALKSGQDVLLQISEHGILITTLDANIKQAQAKLRKLANGRSLVNELKQLRATDYDV